MRVEERHSHLIRILLGTYCFLFFIAAARSVGGINLFAEIFMGRASLILTPAIWLGALFSTLVITGYFVRGTSLCVLLCIQIVLQGAPLIREFQYPQISMMLILFILFYGPRGISGRSTWHFPLLLAVYLGFSISGISKLFFKDWVSGWGVSILCFKSPLADLIGDGFCHYLPMQATAIAVALIEALALPLIIFPRTRFLIWALNTLLHVGIIFYMRVWPVSVCALLMQMFLFDPNWLKEPFGSPKRLSV